MKCEIPMFTRCCFCFPLRFGLLVWAYIKLIFSLFLFINTLGFTVMTYRSRDFNRKGSLFASIIAHVLLAILVLDIIFLIVFIISAHKKEVRKMKIFYNESIFAFAFYVITFIILLSFIFTNYEMIEDFTITSACSISLWIIVVQAYVTFLVKSEIVKLERNTDFQFVNHTAEDTAEVVINCQDA